MISSGTHSKKMSSSVDRGSKASVSGIAYEKKIAAACAKVKSPHCALAFHTDLALGGCGADVDIRLNWRKANDVWLEAKRPTPDWMQMKLHRDEAGVWRGADSCKIPAASRVLFEAIIGSKPLFGGKTPTFLERRVTYPEWVEIKAANPEFSDVYITCTPNTISDLYKAKGCAYIQVDGKGLFHTGVDVCGFGVPYFSCEQRVRIRLKVHGRKLGGHALLSVMAAAQPVKLDTLAPSPYSLDNAAKMPPALQLVEGGSS
jgi:hypothetical protein